MYIQILIKIIANYSSVFLNDNLWIYIKNTKSLKKIKLEGNVKVLEKEKFIISVK